MKRHELQQEILQAVLSPETSIRRLNTALSVLTDTEIGAGTVQTAGFLDDAAARRYAGNVSRTQLWNWRKTGLRSYKVGGRILYRGTDIDAFFKIMDQQNSTS